MSRNNSNDVRRVRVRSWVAGTLAFALGAGALVAGVGVQMASAASPAPEVTVTQQSAPYLAGEDVTVNVTMTSGGASAGEQYNLSAAILLPTNVTIRSTGGAFGPYLTFGPGETLPNRGLACAEVGLLPVGASCKVPDDAQYLVFQNVSDLPEDASNVGTLTLRPRATSFPVGTDRLNIQAAVFSSNAERYVPNFPGSTGTGTGAHTSATGSDTLNIRVEALRLEKSEPSPENELLRGVHLNSTTYTLRVHHTGEGNISGTEVVDFLPAGLEYLGMGGIDNTRGPANGTQPDGQEYPGSGGLEGTPAPAGSAPNAGTVEKSVETVVPTPEEVATYKLDAGKVYTKVVWDLQSLLAAGDARDVKAPIAQGYSATAGVPGVLEIRYRAGVPLFENTLDFGYAPNATGEQAANLDNNRGASTRHGSVQTDPGLDDNGNAQALTNVAGVSGTYAGPLAEGTDPSSGDIAAHTVDAVDVRVLKSVKEASFTQGELAVYTLNIATSEYASAELGTGGSAQILPNRVTDDMGDGICPVFPANVPITPGASSIAGVPRLVIGDPNATPRPDDMTPQEWNEALGQIADDCWSAEGRAGAELSGATLSGIAFDPATGHFALDLSIAPIAAANGAGHVVTYTASQNALYAQDDSRPGATSSGDTVRNTVDLEMTTTSIPALNGVTSSGGAEADGTWRAWDDSGASLKASLSKLDKRVLPRSAGVPSAAEIVNVPNAQWETDQPLAPFAAGDEVWWKITLTPPAGADVRDARLTDFLPVGTEFDPAQTGGRFDNIAYRVSNQFSVGACQPVGRAAWLDEFVPNPTITDEIFTWNLGSTDCVAGNTTDRFFPRSTTLDVFIKTKIVDVAAFGQVDLPENLAKYQQRNNAGEVFFLRDQAAVQLDTGVRLMKGIDSINAPATSAGFNSNNDVGQVVQGDEVRFRLDVTAPSVQTENYALYDALPKGIRARDLAGFVPATHAIDAQAEIWDGVTATSTSAFTARAYDWADLPAEIKNGINAAYTNRTIVVWTLAAAVPGSTLPIAEKLPAPAVPGVERGFTLKYTVVIPDGSQTADGGGAAALLDQRYLNTASVAQFDVRGNAVGASSTIVVQPGAGQGTVANGGGSGSSAPVFSRDLVAGEFSSGADLATDPSSVRVPNATMDKSLVSTEIAPSGTAVTDPNNGATRIVQGEYATYDVSVTLPALTTVRSGVLADTGKLLGTGSGTITGATPANTVAYHVASATLHAAPGVASGTVPANFAFDSSTGSLAFPEFYTVGATPETFTVRLKVWVDDIDASHATGRPNIPHNKGLQNTANFDSKDVDNLPNPRLSDTADVVYIEPGLAIAKTANKTSGLHAGDAVLYTLAVTNSGSRPVSYDNTVVDTVPAGLMVDTDQPALAGATFSSAADLQAGLGGTITWSHTAFTQLKRVPATVNLSYVATIEPTTGGGSAYLNSAKVTGYTLPDTLTDAATRRGDRVASDTETVRADTAAIAKGVRVAGDTNYNSTSVSAPIGQTVQYKVDVTLRPGITYYNAKLEDTLPAGVELVEATISGPSGSSSPAGDPSSWTHAKSGQVHSWTYQPNNGDIASSPVERTLTLTYDVLLKNTVAAGVNALTNTAKFGWTETTNPSSQAGSVSDNARVDILNPVLAIVKKVDGQDAVQKSPQDGFEYTVAVTNTGNTPAHNVTVTDTVPVGVIVTESSLTASGGVLTGAGANGGGTITWTLAGPLHQQSGTGTPKSLNFTYSATFAESEALTAAGLTNTARVTRFESFGTGGRVYTPAGISDTAQVTPLFPKVDLTKTVSDGSLAYVDESFGWTLKLVNSGQGAAQTLDVTDVLPKNWSFDANSARISVGGAAAVPLVNPVVGAESGKATLTWNLGSASPAAPILPGAAGGATLAQRTVVITFTATPSALAASDAGTGVNVKAHTNTLRAVTTDGTGATNNATGGFTGANSSADAFLGAADLVIKKTGAEDPLVAGTTAIGWSILVSNAGPDTAAGPITVTDTTGALPAGITVTEAAGEGWTCELPVRGTDGVTTFVCARTDAADSLASGAFFPVIEVEVEVADDQAAETNILNSARVVPGRTVDPDPDNNTSEAPISTTTSADLEIEKTVTTQDPTAGAAITWQLAPVNHGPSVSVHTDAAPITITDTIPAGISGVADPSTTHWAATTSAAGGFPVTAGDTVTWTYTGTQLAVGAAPNVTLSGTIDAGWTGGNIVNSAEIAPGETPDPEPNNNTDDVTVTPGDSTTLAIDKTRVVFEGGSWVAAASLDPVPSFEPGADISYRITVVNNGPADARVVRVVDEVPAGLTYKTHASGTGTWTRAAGPGAWETFALGGTQQVGAVHATSFVVTFATDPAMDPAVALVNWAEASAENSTNTPRDDDSTSATRDADLSIEKSHTAPALGVAAIAGESVSYQLVVTNHGPSISDAPISVDDVLPAGFSYAAGSAMVSVAGGTAAAVDPAVEGQTLTWANLTSDVALAPSETIVISFTANIAATVGEQAGVLNTATVDGPNDTDPGNNSDTDPVDIVTQADMVITKDVAAGPWVAGTDVSYTIAVQNDGPSVADASVTDLLPAGVSFVSISGSAGWTCTDASDTAPASCAYPAHPVGVDSASTITVVGHIASNVVTGTELTNLAELEWVDSRGDHEGSDDADITVTTLADLLLLKTAIDAEGDETGAAVAGEQSRYRLTVTNDGPSDAIAPLTVTDTLPAGISFVGLTSGSSASWSAVADEIDEVTGTQQVVFTRVPAGTGIADGVTAPAIDFDVLVDQAVADGSVLTNTATIASGTPEANVDNNTDTADLTVGREVDVSIAKSHDADAVRIGDALPFTLQVTNGGPSVASGVMVTDLVPFGLEVASAPGDDVGEDWTLVSVDPVDPDNAAAGTRVVASYSGVLVAGEAAPALTLTTTVLTEAYSTVVNTADVTVVEQDRDPANNHAEDPVTVPPLATLVVEKTAVGTFQVGKTGAYRITVSNEGPTEDPGPITVTDVLPDGLTFQSSPDAGVQVNGKTVTWTIDGLAVGESVDLTLIVNVQQAAFPSVTNVVEVASPTELTPESVTVDDATIDVAAADPMPATGSDQLLVLGGIALLLLVAGGAVLVARRRRALSE